MPSAASSAERVSGGVRRSVRSPALPITSPCSSAASTTGPAGRSSSTASSRPRPRTSPNCASASVRNADVERTCASSASSIVSTTAHAAAHVTGFPPKVEAWSPGSSPVGASSATSSAPIGRPLASPFASVTASA